MQHTVINPWKNVLVWYWEATNWTPSSSSDDGSTWLYSFRDFYIWTGLISVGFYVDYILKWWNTSDNLSTTITVQLLFNWQRVDSIVLNNKSAFWDKVLTYSAIEPWFLSLRISWWLYNSSSYRFQWKITQSSVTNTVKRNTNYNYTPKLKPRALKDIWWIWVTTSYWEHIDNSFVWMFVIWETTNIYTWDITLWNAVGYIEVKVNWKKIKLPYYL